MKFNKKYLNWSAWITVLLAYVLPYRSTDGFATTFGYPFPFLTTHKTSINISLLMDESINPLYLALNILIIYLLINFTYGYLVKMKINKGMNNSKHYK